MQRTSNQDQARQLGLTALLGEAEAENRARRFALATAHLPGSLREGIAASFPCPDHTGHGHATSIPASSPWPCEKALVPGAGGNASGSGENFGGLRPPAQNRAGRFVPGC